MVRLGNGQAKRADRVKTVLGKTRLAGTFFLLLFFTAGGLRAATGTWGVNSGGTWSAAGNWTGTVPVSAGDQASLTFNLTAAVTITNDASRSVGILRIGDAKSTYYAYTLTNNPGTVFTLDNGGAGASLLQSNSTAGDVIALPVSLNDSLTVSNGSGETLTISGAISGNQPVLKTGAGTLNLTGANAFTGSMTVTNGTVNVSGNQAAATGGWLLPANLAPATVNFTAGSAIVVAATNAVQVGSSPRNGTPNNQTLNVAGTVTDNGALFVTRGAYLNLNSGAVWVQNGGFTNAPPPASGYGSAVTVNTGGSFTYNGTTPIVMNPALTNGGTAILTVGGTFITGQGFVNPLNPANSSGYAQIILTNGGTLALSANVPELTGGANSNAVPLLSLGTGGGVINTAGYATAVTNGIGGAGSLTKSGAGILTLGATETFSGSLTVSNGTLAFAAGGSALGSSLVTVAGSNAVLQLTQNGTLTNTAMLVVNPGGSIALGGGVNQTVTALYLGGQWAGAGTWGSSASAAGNKNDVYFSGTGVITVAPGTQVMSVTPSFIFSWYARYTTGTYDTTNPVPGQIAYTPTPGPVNGAAIASWTYQAANGWPVAALFEDNGTNSSSGPLADNYSVSGSYYKSNSVADTVAFLTTNTSPAMPLNYLFADFEPYAGSAGTTARCEAETTNMVNLVRASPNTNVSLAYVGNYGDFPGGTDAAMTFASRPDTAAFYLDSGLNLAQPNAYPYSSYTNNGPNWRSGYFWSDLEMVSFVKLNLPSGHRLVPWVDSTLSATNLSPTVDDCVALLAHLRLRGVDGFCDLGGLINLTYGWTDLDWLFHAPGSVQIFNLTTAEASGFQWSGFGVGVNQAFMFSNLGNSDAAMSLPGFPGLPGSTPTVPAGTHLAWYFINDPAGMATNAIYLGRGAINHGLFVSGSITLTNAIQVAGPGTGTVAVVTIGTCFTNSYAPVLSGPVTLGNNVTLQGYGQNLTLAGGISGPGGVTTVGTVTLTNANSYTGGTTVSNGTLYLNGTLAAGGGVTVAAGGTLGGIGTISDTVNVSGTIAPGSGGVGTLATGGETWNGGGAEVFQLNNATNSAGWDALSINGALNLQATAGSPFTLRLVSLTASNTPGPVPGFASGTGKTWTLATASGGIRNFTPGSVTVDTSGFSNAFTGTFSVSTNPTALLLTYTVPPVLSSPTAHYSGTNFSFHFSGTSGTGYHVLATTNLALPITNWTVLQGGTFLGTNGVNFSDGAVTNRQRFYRIVSP